MAEELFAHKEDHAKGVANAPKYEQEKYLWREEPHQGNDGNHDGPAHQERETRGDVRIAPAKDGLTDDGEDREPPDDAEDRPAERSAQRDEGEGRVTARDEQVNRHAIEELHPLACPRGVQRMCERGCQVEEHEGCAVHTDTHDLPCIAVQACVDNENHEPGYGEQEPEAVQDAVGQFFEECSPVRDPVLIGNGMHELWRVCGNILEASCHAGEKKYKERPHLLSQVRPVLFLSLMGVIRIGLRDTSCTSIPEPIRPTLE